MTRILSILLTFCTITILHGAELQKLSALEKQFLPYSGKEVFSLGKDDWKIVAGENKDAISPAFDDSKWFAGKADCALSVQGFSKRKLHTIRKTFNLPAGLKRKIFCLIWDTSPFTTRCISTENFWGVSALTPKVCTALPGCGANILFPLTANG